MRKCREYQEARDFFTQTFDRQKIEKLLDKVNLSVKEKEIIAKSEIDKIDLETICNEMANWNKKSVISYSNLYRIKKSGMMKIGFYLINSNKNAIKA